VSLATVLSGYDVALAAVSASWVKSVHPDPMQRSTLNPDSEPVVSFQVRLMLVVLVAVAVKAVGAVMVVVTVAVVRLLTLQPPVAVLYAVTL
jgi:hypothetical protein